MNALMESLSLSKLGGYHRQLVLSEEEAFIYDCPYHLLLQNK